MGWESERLCCVTCDGCKQTLVCGALAVGRPGLLQVSVLPRRRAERLRVSNAFGAAGSRIISDSKGSPYAPCPSESERAREQA